MMMKTKFVICSVLIIVITACIVSTGCTSTQSAQISVQSNSPTVITPSQTLSPTTAPGTIVPTLAPTTAPTAIVSTAGTTVNNGLCVTVNSAVKKITLGGSNPMPENIFLVLDVTIQNNDKNKDFEYTDSSFAIYDKLNKNRRTALTYKIPGGLNSPLTSGTIPLKSKKTGQIVFGVIDSSNSYKFSVVDSTGTVLTSIDNINVP
jgi:hypothetical protein